MLDEKIMSGRNVADFQRFRELRKAKAEPRLCKFCGAGLNDGEREEDCSGAWSGLALPPPMAKRRFRAE